MGFQVTSAASPPAAPRSVPGQKPRKSRLLQGPRLHDFISAGAMANTVPADDATDENAKPPSSSSSSYEPDDSVVKDDTVDAVVPAAPEVGSASKGGSDAGEDGEHEARQNAPPPFLAVNWNSVSKTAIRTTLGSRPRPTTQNEGLTKEHEYDSPAEQPPKELPSIPNEPGSSLQLGRPVADDVSDVGKDGPPKPRASRSRDDGKMSTAVEVIHIDSDSEDGDMLMMYSSSNPPPTLTATAAGDSALKHGNSPANSKPLGTSPQLQTMWASQVVMPKLTAAEKELQQRYFNIVGSIKKLDLQGTQGAAGDVNEASAEEHDIVYCICCGNEGHVQQDCPELKVKPTCYLRRLFIDSRVQDMS